MLSGRTQAARTPSRALPVAGTAAKNAAAEAAAERLLAEEDARAARRGLKEKLSSRRRDAKGAGMSGGSLTPL